MLTKEIIEARKETIRTAKRLLQEGPKACMDHYETVSEKYGVEMAKRSIEFNSNYLMRFGIHPDSN